MGTYVRKNRPSLSVGIEAMKEETREGRCICCDEPLPPRDPTKPGRIAVKCKDPECRRLYHNVYGNDRRRREGRPMRANRLERIAA